MSRPARGGRERASMGPRPSDRGRLAENTTEMDVEELASMGPRPSDRGRLALLPPRLNPVLRFNGSTAF